MKDRGKREPDPDDPDLAAVARLLDEVAGQEEIEMREARELGRAPGSDRVEASLAAAWGGTTPAARKKTGVWILGLLGVAAMLLAVVFLRSPQNGPEPGPSGQYLGHDGLRVVYPPPRANRWDRIEWTGSEGAPCRLVVRDARTGTVLHGPVDIPDAQVLQLDPATTAGWPDRITIELERREKDGTWTSAAPAVSELTP